MWAPEIPDHCDLTLIHLEVLRRVWSSQYCGLPSSPCAMSPFRDVGGGNSEVIPTPHSVACWGNVRMKANRPIAVEIWPKHYHTVREPWSHCPNDYQILIAIHLHGFSTMRARLLRGSPKPVKIGSHKEQRRRNRVARLSRSHSTYYTCCETSASLQHVLPRGAQTRTFIPI
jgi:hypothetical protein